MVILSSAKSMTTPSSNNTLSSVEIPFVLLFEFVVELLLSLFSVSIICLLSIDFDDCDEEFSD
jgi:hypothetical protein